MKLTPEQLREIAERESLDTSKIREAFIRQSRGNPEDAEECAEEVVIYDLCKALDQNSTDITALLAHIKALEKESWAYQAALRGACAFIESAGFQTTADAYREVLVGADNSKEASHE